MWTLLYDSLAELTEAIPTLIGFSVSDVESFHQSANTLFRAQTQINNLITSLYAGMDFDRKSLWNLMQRALAIACSDERSDNPNSSGIDGETNFLLFRFGQCSEREPSVWFELLVASILSSTSEHDIRMLNPFLSRTAYKTVTSLTVVAMLTSIRISQTHRALTNLTKLVLLLRQVKSSTQLKAQKRLCQEISLLSSTIASDLTSERHYMNFNNSTGKITFDPRFLVFEFTYSIMLRKSQVILVNRFMDALRNNRSMCHQMIMGAGKTTVVAPLLALMLADGNALVTQVVPHALLEMSRSVMREKFAAVVRKPVFTFSFGRGTKVNRDLYMKLVKARESKAVICATPTSIKSLMLKFIEMMRHLDQKHGPKTSTSTSFFESLSLSSIAKRFREQSVIVEMKVGPEDVYYCVQILKLFKDGVLLLDEVDLLLHPLKSELNWPLGIKEPLDFTQSKMGKGLRWEIPWHLLDAIFYAKDKRMTVAFTDSREALLILDQISGVIQRGVEEKKFQHTPHLVLLDKNFYHRELKPLIARWHLLYLRHKRLPKVDDQQLLSYMINGPNDDKQAASAVSVALSDDFMKMINISQVLIRHFIPFVLSKIDRVQYGLLSKDDLELSLESDPNVSLARRLAAIPFVGKDVPSRASQFSHPDVVIGLTILAYRYEGLRRSDFITVINELRERMDSETGPYHKRPSALRFVSWVEFAGGKVRGPKQSQRNVDDESSDAFDYSVKSRSHASDEIWPLHLLDTKDDEHMQTTFNLLRKCPVVMEYYLDSFVFPLTLEHHLDKISASGQDLGGDMLFKRRVGFSGTPSDLLPEELGQCEYEECVDGQILNYLTDESIVSSRMLDSEWSVTKLLDQVAKSDPPFHVLIDTGALVTGMSNYEVAKYLLTNGLHHDFDGVIFLDHKDRKMILLRAGLVVVRASQAGVPPHRRFSFYDQIHTTGMDISQCIDAKAALTLGKDMTFRDYAQGAFRMRGIGKGQTIELFIIPEVMKLIQTKHRHLDQMKASLRNPLGAAKNTPPLQSNGNDLLDLSAPPSSSFYGDTPFTGYKLLVGVAAWLTINGMKSENMQFAMLCRQSVENVWRKNAFSMLSSNCSELTKVSFAGKVKELAVAAASFAGVSADGSAAEVDPTLHGDRTLFADDLKGIKDIMQGHVESGRLIGIPKLRSCLEVLGERIDFIVPNHLPAKRSLSKKLRAEVEHYKEFLVRDYDKAVVEKIIMVLVNSEQLVTSKFGHALPGDDDDAEEEDLHKEQVAEEEIQQEEEVSSHFAFAVTFSTDM